MVLYMELALAPQIVIAAIQEVYIPLYGVKAVIVIGREQDIMIHLAVIKVIK